MEKFEYTIKYLKNKTHPHPQQYQEEVDFVIKILKEGQGYLTRRTSSQPYTKVIFYDQQKEHIEMAEAGCFKHKHNFINENIEEIDQKCIKELEAICHGCGDCEIKK